MRALFLVIASSVAVNPPIMAQVEARSLIWGQRFAAAIHSIFPGAQLQPRRLPPRFSADSQRWDYQGSDISLSFTELESDRAAEKFLVETTATIPLPSRPVAGFGDQAFFFDPRGSAQRHMNLRRHNLVLEIEAPDEIALSRLALALVGVIDKSQARQEPRR